MITDPFLIGLPAPAVVEELSFESILTAMQNDLITRFPDIAPIIALESSAANKIMEVCAYRELILRARINDAARANLLAYASGTDLDHVGANSSPPVARMYQEEDDRFRERILLTVRARNVGSFDRYRLIALNTSTMVRDALAYRNGRDPTINVAILSTDEGGVASEALIDLVQDEFEKDENRLINSPVVVLSAVTAVANITASLTLVPGTPSTITIAAEAALRAAWDAEGGIGRDLTREWIAARLMVVGVYSVNVTAPASDVIKPPFQAASIGTITLTVAGENE